MLLLKHSLEGAVGILVSHEIEKAGVRAAHRVKEAFGNLAISAKESIEVNIDVENNSGEVVIHIKYKGIEVAGSDDRDKTDPVPSNHINHGSMTKDVSTQEIDVEELSGNIAADNPVDGEDYEISPDDIEMIDTVETKCYDLESGRTEVDDGLATLMMEDDDLNGPERHIDTV